ncbi:MAG: TMEM14 family protein [Acidobacteriota bacterium]
MVFQIAATIVYGLLIAGGGVVGFVAAKSVPSLISGGLLGLAALAGGLLMAVGHPVGFRLAVAAAALTGAFFGVKLATGLAKGKPVGRAAGILALSLAELAILAFIG